MVLESDSSEWISDEAISDEAEELEESKIEVLRADKDYDRDQDDD